MVSENIKNLLIKIQKNPSVLKELNDALLKIYALSETPLTLEEKKELITVIGFAITGYREKEHPAGGTGSYSVTF
ncbi:MAG: hypothetical protein EHM45_09770 [Desulfobacteraceae bacterium]|nr:MAG: hypothetical protein EHM45_09770 [Desulfobacteraceae bacterium]